MVYSQCLTHANYYFYSYFFPINIQCGNIYSTLLHVPLFSFFSHPTLDIFLFIIIAIHKKLYIRSKMNPYIEKIFPLMV